MSGEPSPDEDAGHALVADRHRKRYPRSPPGVSPIVREDEETITIRRPVQYYSINTDAPSRAGTQHMQATQHRYRYYSRLDPQSYSSLLMPNHIVPPEFYLVIPIKPAVGSQSSIVTIFSIWNTMMGTSILSMPWALERAGFGCGIAIMIIMGLLTLYTAIKVLKSPQHISEDNNEMEFTDVCRHYLGRWGEYISIIFSLVALLGAAIVYWVLMSNFLFHSVKFIYDEVNHEFNSTKPSQLDNQTELDVYCPHPPSPSGHHDNHTVDSFSIYSTPSSSLNSDDNDIFRRVWSQTNTVPFFLLVILVPLINFKSPTFFTKFNALGTISVIYILSFIVVKASKWGLNLDFSGKFPDFEIPQFQYTFPALTGTLSLAFFIHNCVLSIVRNQKNPQHNTRDVSIAFFCVAFTYIFIGVVFYMCFPLPKMCIEDNLLNNFRSSDIMAFAARLFLLFQMVTVFPLLSYIFRAQILNVLFGSAYPSLKHVLGANAFLLSLCLVFAVFLPQIGNIIRFSGALCGLVYIFALPCIVYMIHRKQKETLTKAVIAFHVIIILIGFLNFIAQFVIIGL